MSLLSKTSLTKYIEANCGDLSLEKQRTKLSLLFGYYAGFNMGVESVAGADGTYNSLFNSQWPIFEKIMVDINEIRPLDFELAKSTAATILMGRSRLSKGTLTNLFLPSNNLQVLDFEKTSSALLGAPITTQEMTLFFTAVDLFSSKE